MGTRSLITCKILTWLLVGTWFLILLRPALLISPDWSQVPTTQSSFCLSSALDFAQTTLGGRPAAGHARQPRWVTPSSRAPQPQAGSAARVAGRKAAPGKGRCSQPAGGASRQVGNASSILLRGTEPEFATFCTSDPTRQVSIYEKIETSGKICL